MMSEEENIRNWEEYFIPGTDVLKNKLGIANRDELREKETEITFGKLLELHQTPIELNFDSQHFRAIHYYLFSDIYDFAGKNRTVYMQKNNSYFAPVDQIDFRLDYTLNMMNQEYLHVNSKYEFAAFLAAYYAELLQIHPFREGNGRTTREFIREFANAKSRELPFGEIDFSWSNVNSDIVNELIDKSIAYRSAIELQFLNAMDTSNTKKDSRAY